MSYQNDIAFAQQMDEADPLRSYRQQFHFPQHEGRNVYYFTGNSLGLQPKSVRAYVEEELEAWERLGVEGHFKDHKRPWAEYHRFSKSSLAKLVGAQESEVVSMNGLTVNLHLLMVSFYRPDGKRHKIICEAGAFPSDQYMFESQLKFHGYNPEEALIELKPREGEQTLRQEDILAKIEETGEELALVLMAGVQYYTGQLFDMKSITAAGRAAGAIVGFDLAHAMGNVPLSLHDWGVDFATWCSYKYLNSGPGNVSGIYVHEKHGNNPNLPRFAGWWGHNEEARFLMEKGFQPMTGADGWQLSNVNVLSTAAHLASLAIFDEVGMEALREKSLKLTGYLEFLINDISGDQNLFEIITPADPKSRGCQLSVFCHQHGRALFDKLSAEGVIADWREPNVIRVAPVPLYNSFEDAYHLARILKESISEGLEDH